jgi:hypothetical protein
MVADIGTFTPASKNRDTTLRYATLRLTSQGDFVMLRALNSRAVVHEKN